VEGPCRARNGLCRLGLHLRGVARINLLLLELHDDKYASAGTNLVLWRTIDTCPEIQSFECLVLVGRDRLLPGARISATTESAKTKLSLSVQQASRLPWWEAREW